MAYVVHEPQCTWAYMGEIISDTYLPRPRIQGDTADPWDLFTRSVLDRSSIFHDLDELVRGLSKGDGYQSVDLVEEVN